MAFTTSDIFICAYLRFTNLIRGSCCKGKNTRMVIIFIILLDEADSQRLKLVRKHAYGLGNTQRDMGIE